MAVRGTLLRSATIVAEDGVVEADIRVAGGVIVAVGPALAAHAGDEVIDVQGHTILPGAVDLHVHFEEPGNEQREDFGTGTAAAAAGGITFVVEHPLSEPPTTTAERYRSKVQLVGRHAWVDFSLWGGAIPGNVGELSGMAALGAPGFKAFMVGSEPEYPRLEGESLRAAMAAVAQLDAILVVHAEDEGTINAATNALIAAGRKDPLAWAESRPPESEVKAVREAVALARETGCRTHLAHLSTPGSVDAVNDAKSAGADVRAETCPHYLLLDTSYLERLGPWAKCAPPLRSRAESETLLARAVAGEIDVIASDHAPWEPAEKTMGLDDIWEARNGFQSLQLMNVLGIPAWLRAGGTLESWANRTSTAPARWIGLYPRKGVIAEGADADLAIYRQTEPRGVTAAELWNKHKWTPFEGMETTWEVAGTMVRGQWAFHDGRLADLPFGRFTALTAAQGAGAVA